jgi:hypothetical protein
VEHGVAVITVPKMLKDVLRLVRARAEDGQLELKLSHADKLPLLRGDEWLPERASGLRLPIGLVAEADTVGDLLRALHEAEPSGARIEPLPTVTSLTAISAATEAKTLLEVLEWHVAQHPDRLHLTVLEDEKTVIGTLTYGELAKASRTIAAGLIERDIMQREMERQALKKEKDAASKERLKKLEKELAELKEKSNALKAEWQKEKSVIDEQRKIKEELDQARTESERAQRRGALFSRRGRTMAVSCTESGAAHGCSRGAATLRLVQRVRRPLRAAGRPNPEPRVVRQLSTRSRVVTPRRR